MESEDEEGSADSDEEDGGDGRAAGRGGLPPDPYVLACPPHFIGDKLSDTRPTGFGVTSERWERQRRGGVRGITYAGEHRRLSTGEIVRDGLGIERTPTGARVQGQWESGCFHGHGEMEAAGGEVRRGLFRVDGATGQSVLAGWGAVYLSPDAPEPHERGKYVGGELQEEGAPPASEETLWEEALEAAAEAEAKGHAARRAAMRETVAGERRAPAGAPAEAAEAAAPRRDESSEAKLLRVCLREDDHVLVETYEDARRRGDAAATTAALRRALDRAGLTYLRDEESIQAHERREGLSWKGTEANVGTMSRDVARATYLRRCRTDYVFESHGYSLAGYKLRRMSAEARRAWLQGSEQDAPEADVDDIFNKIVLKKAAAVLAPNPAKRTSGTQMVTGVIGEKRVREALMPTENEQREREIRTLQAKLAALEAEKGAAKPAADKRPASRQQPASRGAAAAAAAAAGHARKGGGTINSSRR